MPISIRSLVVSSTPICLAFASIAVFANPNDSLQFIINSSISYDDNLFRLSESVNPKTAVGRDSAEEVIKTTTATAAFVKDYGLQHVDVKASAVNYDYQNFSYLSFTALNYAGAVAWKLTPRVRGNLRVDRKESLSGFNDFRNFSVRNQRTETNERADAVYELDGAWQLTGGLSHNRLQNESTFVELRSYSLVSADGGVKRVFPSGSELAWRVRKGSGTYSQVSYAASGFLPASFDETENEIHLVWPFTVKSRIDARVSYLNRTTAPYATRDFSGVRGSALMVWGVTSRTSLSTTLSREIGEFQTNYSSYSTTDRLNISPVLMLDEKLALKLTQEVGKRNFAGPVPGVVVPVQRTDRFQFSRMSVEWQPREFLAFSAWLQRDKRASNFSGLDYVSQSVGVLAQVSF